MRVILASKSPRRREILWMLGVQFEILSADADESSDIADPALLVRELALRKGRATRALLQERGEWDENTLIIASDTVVANGNEILGKVEGIITISYEDDFGETYTETVDVSTVIEEKVITADIEEEEEKKNPLWWLFMLIGAIIGGALGFGIPHVIRSNKQRKEDEKRL